MGVTQPSLSRAPTHDRHASNDGYCALLTSHSYRNPLVVSVNGRSISHASFELLRANKLLAIAVTLMIVVTEVFSDGCCRSE